MSITEVRPLLRGHLHALAFLATLPAGAMLIAAAERGTARAVAAVYTASLLLLFGTSASYHCLARVPRTRGLLRRLDHAMIYVLIAGTYTPICLIALPVGIGVPLLAIVGVGAAIGIASKLIAFDGLGRRASILYLVLGWVALIAFPILPRILSPGQIGLFLAGGVIYTGGFVVLALRRPDPWPRLFGYHELWHFLTVLAGVLHFAGVVTLVA